MILRALNNRELATFAEGDARYQQDPLFTELVQRLVETSDRHTHTGNYIFPKSHVRP